MEPNNYIIKGTTAVLYNVELTRFFNGNGTLKSEFQGSLQDIGFRIKPSASTIWEEFSIRKNWNGTPFNSPISNISDIEDNFIGPQARYRYKRFNIYKNHIYPCRVLFTGLQTETSYDLESWFIKNGNITYFNAQTVTTLPQSGVVSYDALSWDDRKVVPADKIDEVTTVLVEALNEMCDIYNMFCPVEYSFTPVVYWDSTIITTASSDMRYNGYNCIKYGVKSTAVHEMAHNLYNSGGGTAANKRRFMEFATSVESAKTKTLAGHFYPVISGAQFDYMDNCLVAAACWVSRQNI